MTQDTARQRLREAGFQVADQATPVNSTAPYGAVVGTSPDRSDGARLDHHDPDLQRHPAATASAAGRCDPRASAGMPPEIGSTVVEIPGLPPITVPVLGPPPPPPPPPP